MIKKTLPFLVSLLFLSFTISTQAQGWSPASTLVNNITFNNKPFTPNGLGNTTYTYVKGSMSALQGPGLPTPLSAPTPPVVYLTCQYVSTTNPNQFIYGTWFLGVTQANYTINVGSSYTKTYTITYIDLDNAFPIFSTSSFPSSGGPYYYGETSLGEAPTPTPISSTSNPPPASGPFGSVPAPANGLINYVLLNPPSLINIAVNSLNVVAVTSNTWYYDILAAQLTYLSGDEFVTYSYGYSTNLSLSSSPSSSIIHALNSTEGMLNGSGFPAFSTIISAATTGANKIKGGFGGGQFAGPINGNQIVNPVVLQFFSFTPAASPSGGGGTLPGSPTGSIIVVPPTTVTPGNSVKLDWSVKP